MGKIRNSAFTNSVVIALLSVATLSGCSTVAGWFGKDDAPTTPELLDNTKTQQSWHCYGKGDGSGWQCEDEKNPSLITEIKPPTAQERLPKPEPVVIPVASIAPPVEETTQVENSPNQTVTEQLLSRPEDHYAVQIIALQKENSVISYAKRNGIPDPMYVKIHSRGQNWYVLLLGLYENKATANKAKNEWEKTKSLRAKPWLRQLGSLQEAIRAVKGG